MALFGRNSDLNIPEIEVQGPEFTVRQPQGGEPEPVQPREPEPIRVPERKGKIPPHSWGV